MEDSSDTAVFAAAIPAEARARVAAPRGASNRALWFGVLAPPAAWSTDLLTSIATHQDFCAAFVGHVFKPWGSLTLLLSMSGIVALLVAVSAGVVAWRAHAAIGSDDGRGNTDIDRRRFMARAGLIASALFSYGIFLRVIAPFVVPVTWCR